MIEQSGSGNTTYVTTTYISNNISGSFNDSSSRTAYNLGGCLFLLALPILLGFLCYVIFFTTAVAAWF